MRVVEVHGQKFLAGLEWYALARSELKEFLKERSPEFYALVEHGEYVNVGVLEEEVSRKYLKLPLLAPTLALSQEPPWAGVFELGEGLYYHLAVGRDYLILPGGEVIGTREECLKAYDQNLELVEGWKSLNADYSKDDLYALLSRVKKRYYLKGVSFADAFKKNALLVGIVLGLLLGGLYVYKQKKKERVPPTTLKREVVKKTVRVENTASGAYPWDLVSTCYKAFYEEYDKYPGWVINQVVCGEGFARIELRRGDGTYVYRGDDIRISSNSASKELRIDITSYQVRSSLNQEVAKSLQEWAYSYGVSFSPPRLVQEQKGEGLVLSRVEFQASGKDPLALGELCMLKGILLKELTVSSSGWSVKGIVVE